MKILFVTSECAPFSKSGGLADVAYSLPPALLEAGNEVAIITPMYQCVKERFGDQLTLVTETAVRLGEAELYCGLYKGELHGVTVWFVDNEGLFLRPKLYGYDDDKFRFAWFSRAVLHVLTDLDFMPEILHCNDWETAPVVIYLKNDQAHRKELRSIKTVYTIHNIAYQGQFGANELWDTFALPWGWYDGGLGYEYEGRQDINLMKGAMLMADAVSTVSATYARELHRPEFGAGLQGVVQGKGLQSPAAHQKAGAIHVGPQGLEGHLDVVIIITDAEQIQNGVVGQDGGKSRQQRLPAFPERALHSGHIGPQIGIAVIGQDPQALIKGVGVDHPGQVCLGEQLAFQRPHIGRNAEVSLIFHGFCQKYPSFRLQVSKTAGLPLRWPDVPAAAGTDGPGRR